MRKLFYLLSFFMLASFCVQAQSRTVTGVVRDINGIPLSGVSVSVRGSTVGTTTNSEGVFSLSVPGNATTLVITSATYQTQEVNVEGQTSVTVQLTPSERALEEVVVVGYGTQRRTNVTSSVASVKSTEIENRPFTSVDQMLQGKVTGLQAPPISGQPGALQSVRIRGIGSVSAGSDPLYVVDGIIMNTGDLTNNTTTANALAGLNPNDIETLNVLKDAQATSIYGSRGANGVIVITTKRGRAGKTRFRADIEVGNNKLADRPDGARFLNADEWLTLLEEGVVNAGGSQADVDEIAQYYGKGSGVNTNWYDLVTRTGKQQQYNLSVSGGDAKNQFYVSGGYFNQEGVVIASDFKRYSFRTNYKHTASDKFNFSVLATASNSIQHTPSNGGSFSNPVGSVAFLRPTQNPYNEDGTLNINTDGAVSGNAFNGNYNPLYIAENDRYDMYATLLQGSIGGEYSILRNLKFTSRFGVDYNNVEEYSLWNQFHGDGVSYGGIGFPLYNRYFNWIATNQLDYNANIPGVNGLKMDAKLGYEAQKSKAYFITAAAQGFPPFNELFLTENAATPVQADASASDFSMAGIYSSVTFNLNDKYVLSGSLRRDGSSRFSENNRHGTFWSVGGAWNIDRENFLGNVDFLSSLKLRGSYGTTGNAEIGNYSWRPQIGFGVNYGGQPGGVFDEVGNENLTWESTAQANVGLDATFLSNRLGLVVDVYRRVSDNLLFLNPLSATTGFISFTDNIGKMENKGIEFAINGSPIRTKDFTWDINFNFSHNKNKILSLPDGKDIIQGSFMLREGEDYRTFYLREWAGVDPENGDPLWYVDGSHEETTNNYSSAQRQLFGSASPKYFGGLSTTLNYKGFEVQGDLAYNYGNYVRDQWIFYVVDGVDPTANKYAINLQRWQKPGDITNVPRYEYQSSNSSSSSSTRFLYKGDFIKLRNITVGYNAGNKLISRFGLTTLRLYVRGTNLWMKTYDENLTIDPEQGVNGLANFDAFYPKSMTVGLNIGF